MSLFNTEQENKIESIYTRARSLSQLIRSVRSDEELVEILNLSQLKEWNKILAYSKTNVKERTTLIKSLDQEPELNWQSHFREILSFYSKQYTKDSLKENDYPFLDFFNPFVAYARKNFQWKNDLSVFTVSPPCIDELLLDLSKRLHKISIQSLIESYNKERSINGKKFSPSDFIENQRNDLALTFFATYPCLAKLLVHEVLYWHKEMNLLQERLNGDHELIRRSFRLENFEISQIIIEEGFPSSSFGRNKTLNFNPDKKLIYKTKSGANDILYNEILDWIEDKHGLYFKRPKVIDKHSYSWHEYIDYHSCDSKKEIEFYYYKLGYLSLFFLILGSEDYHFGNLIAHSQHPVFIDHETIFYPFRKNHKWSLTHSKILSAKNKSYPLLSAFHNKAKIKVPTLVLKKGKIKMKEKTRYWEGNNVPIFNGKIISAKNYIGKIEEGFQDAAKLLSVYNNEFVNFMKDKLQTDNITFRLLMRPSKFYLQALYGSYKPDCLTSGVNRSLFLERLFSDSSFGSKSFNSLLEPHILECNMWPRFTLSNEKDHTAFLTKKNRVIEGIKFRMNKLLNKDSRKKLFKKLSK